MSGYLVNRINNVVLFLKNADKLISKFWSPFILGSYINKDNLTIIPRDEESKYIDSLDIIEFKLFSNFGKQLKTYKFINKEIISSVLSKVYIIDSILSIVKFKKNNNLVYTDFIDSDKPTVSIDSLWHPCLKKEKIVTNDIRIGNTTDNPNNVIITGTNAAGKSLLIKSLLVNTLLSQTCTLSTSLSCKMTPFYFINSQISIPDCTGYESLFQAEMHRCKSNLDSLSKLPNNKLALIIIDEIFNSTNPVEAIAGGYAICKKISNYSNTVMIFTTHFSYLTKLSKATKKFKNYKMETIFNNGNINFTYKLKTGINKQYIALELLKKEGFDTDIIDEAILIKNKLL
jgi:DNA mismatch repair ATPase MutS